MGHQCIILCLPPHTTHETQPLDVGIFASLKVQWGRVCHNFYQKNPGKIVNKFNFNTLFSEAWYGAVTSVNIMAGFRKAGVFPFNPNAVTISTPPDKSAEQHSPEGREASPVMSMSHCTGSESVSASESNECLDDSGIPISDPGLLEAHVSDPCTHQDPEPQMCDPTETTANCNHGVVAGPSFTQEQRRRYQIRYEEGFDVGGDPDYVSWLRINHPDSTLPQDHTGESLLNHFSDVTPVEEIAVDSSPPDKADTSQTTVSNFSKFLIPPQVSTPTGQKGQPPRARLLTSSAALEILKEKEKKKQEEAEMKEKRKKEREEAKKRKEEEQKRKAEERAKKQEQKAKEKAEKEAKKGKTKQTTGVGTKRSQVARSTRPAKSPRLAPNPSSRINDSEC